MSQEKREALMKELTEAAHKVLPHIPKSSFYTYIRDYPPENVGIGGIVLQELLKSQE